MLYHHGQSLFLPSHLVSFHPLSLFVASVSAETYLKHTMLVGPVNSAPVSLAIQYSTNGLNINNYPIRSLPTLTPLLDQLGLYTCNISLSVPTSNGFCTSKLPLQCSHTPGESDIILGSEWMSTCGATLCNDGSGLVDPPHW